MGPWAAPLPCTYLAQPYSGSTMALFGPTVFREPHQRPAAQSMMRPLASRPVAERTARGRATGRESPMLLKARDRGVKLRSNLSPGSDQAGHRAPAPEPWGLESTIPTAAAPGPESHEQRSSPRPQPEDRAAIRSSGRKAPHSAAIARSRGMLGPIVHGGRGPRPAS